MGATVVVREAASADIETAVALWTASHVARRNGRPLPEAHITLAQQRMAAPEALLLLAHGSVDDGSSNGSRGGGAGGADGTSGASGAGASSLIGTILGIQGLDQDGAGAPVPGLLHISLLSVAPDRWGQHVGRLLVEAVLTRARAGSFREAQLWTHADNLRANRLYKAMGFRRSGRVRVDDWGELLVHYRRSLTD
ncbi:GNAT family N-acetyltransferase [Streptacidiphilus sp. N1-3]|uniref:GNAT family N-acetyltransferase n=1 Tax=Streptacidiphilus alkalitolerans TaxID=3342712 RepID=A0ABV6X4R0_9ACTN